MSFSDSMKHIFCSYKGVKVWYDKMTKDTRWRCTGCGVERDK